MFMHGQMHSLYTHCQNETLKFLNLLCVKYGVSSSASVKSTFASVAGLSLK